MKNSVPENETDYEKFRRHAEEVEAEKDRKRAEREAKKREKELKKQREKQEKLVAPILLLITILIAMVLYAFR